MKFLYLYIFFYFFIVGCTDTANHLPNSIKGTTYAQVYSWVTKIDSKYIYTQLESIYPSIKNNNDAVSLQLKLAYNYYSLKRYALSKQTEENLLQYLKTAKENKWTKHQADALQSVANYYWNATNDKKKGLQFFNDAYEIYKEIKTAEFPDKFRYLYEYAGAYYLFEDYDKAIELYKAAIASDANYDKGITISAYNTIGLSYKGKGEYTLALENYNHGITLAKKHNTAVWQSIIEGNIGFVYFLMNRNAEALPLLQNEVKRGSTHNDYFSASAATLYLAQMQAASGNTTDAIEKLHQARQYSTLANDRNIKVLKQIFDQQKALYQKTGNYQLALQYADSAKKINDSIQAKFSTNILLLAQQRIEAEKYITENEGSKKLNKYIRNSLLFGIGLLAIISLLFISKQKIKHQKKAEADEAEKKQLAFQLNAYKHDLDVFTKHIEEKNSLIEQIADKKQQEVKQEDKYTNIAKLEKSVLLTDEQWNEFTELFEKVHGNFLQRLKDKIPAISPAEVRIITLSKLNLSNKAMAGMLGITPDAVRMNKHRIRKKLQLDEESDFEFFLENV